MTEEDHALLAASVVAARNAYAPYSRFRVGAAVRAGGKVFCACNIENASYGLSMCAERNAIFQAVSAGHRRIDAVALSCVDAPAHSLPQLLMPCGACRQVMAEFAGPELRVAIAGVGLRRLSNLLPEPFNLAL